ncbi:MAG TPA: GNAT family N-acetyltransferase [Acidimicrobiales bacterium]|nr:GNAT family N-acetyltransferase [Acidimicrobiales bacterium]
MIRLARAADAERLRSIERAAGAAFAEVGLDAVAADEPLAVEVLVAYAEAGRAWVEVDDADEAVGYVVVDLIDGCAHVEQISVDPEHQGRGLARRLLDAVEAWAGAHRLPALTLTTFTEVAWNASLYEHLGFRRIADDAVGPELRALVAHEAAAGLDPGARTCMRRPVATTRRAAPPA